MVEVELIQIWNAIDAYKDEDLLVKVYNNFVNDVFKSYHISFFCQTHRVIDQVVNGDLSHNDRKSISHTFVKVERVVDIVSSVFKSGNVLSLFDNTNGAIEIPF